MSVPQDMFGHIRALVEGLAQRDQRITSLEAQVAASSNDVRVIGGRTCVVIGDRIHAYDEEANATGRVIGYLHVVMIEAPPQPPPQPQPLQPQGRGRRPDPPLRNMSVAFTDGQLIVHPLKRRRGQPVLESAWVGTFCSSRDAIMRDGIAYPSLSAFAVAHRGEGWRECFCAMGGVWVSTNNLGL